MSNRDYIPCWLRRLWLWPVSTISLVSELRRRAQEAQEIEENSSPDAAVGSEAEQNGD
jgi:hypothetical protein